MKEINNTKNSIYCMTVIAGIIGLFVPGTGQVYHRKYIEGALIFFLWLLWIVLAKYFFELEPVYVLIGWGVFAFYSAIDGILFEDKKTREEDIRIKEFEEMKKLKEKKEEFKKIDKETRETFND